MKSQQALQYASDLEILKPLLEEIPKMKPERLKNLRDEDEKIYKGYGSNPTECYRISLPCYKIASKDNLEQSELLLETIKDFLKVFIQTCTFSSNYLEKADRDYNAPSPDQLHTSLKDPGLKKLIQDTASLQDIVEQNLNLIGAHNRVKKNSENLLGDQKNRYAIRHLLQQKTAETFEKFYQILKNLQTYLSLSQKDVDSIFKPSLNKEDPFENYTKLSKSLFGLEKPLSPETKGIVPLILFFNATLYKVLKSKYEELHEQQKTNSNTPSKEVEQVETPRYN